MIKAGLKVASEVLDIKTRLLVIITVISWFIFPLMLKQLSPVGFQVGFALCLLTVVVVVLITAERNQLAPQFAHKLMVLCWLGYLIALLFASLESGSMYSLSQWSFLFVKFLFFVFLLLYLNERYIKITLRIYANLMVATVIFALAAILLPANSIPPLATVDLGGRLGHFYFGAFIVHTDFICPPAAVFRMQGLSEEPGTYAFALLPALFWLLIAEKAYFRSMVIVLGLMFSYSLGVGLFLLLLLLLMAGIRTLGSRVPQFFILAICAIGSMYLVSGYCRASQAGGSGKAHGDGVISVALSDKSLRPATYQITVTEAGKSVSHVATQIAGNDGPGERAELSQLRRASAESEEAEVAPVKHDAMSGFLDTKLISFHDRVDGLRATWKYFQSHLIGTGAALGMSTVRNSISVGYAVAVLESGIMGGLLYLVLFSTMGWLALKEIVSARNEPLVDPARLVVALSVCTVLVMGAQRMQPDLSWWHMWIYAMWLYLLQEDGGRKSARSQISHTELTLTSKGISK